MIMRGLAVLLAAAGCEARGPGVQGDPAILEAPLERLALVVASDDTSGAYAVVDLERQEAFTRIELTHGDVMLRVHDGLGYVVNRLNADNVQVVDPTASFATTGQWSVGPGANPADIAVHGGRAFVPLYQAPEVAIHDPTTGERTGGVDLSSLADGDGNPEAAGVAATGGRLFVPLQRLDWTTFTSAEGGARLAIIDPGAASLIDSLELRLPNPALPPRVLDDGRMALTAWDRAVDVDNGGIEVVDAAPPFDTEVVVGEGRFGGTLTGVAGRDGDTWFVVVHTGDLERVSTRLVRYVASTDEESLIAESDGFHFGDVALTADGLLLVCDRTPERPGLRIFDARTLRERTADPIPTGLPPLRVAPLVSPGASG